MDREEFKMTIRKRNFLENQLPYLRGDIKAIGEYGRSLEYYLDHLDSIVKKARYIAGKLVSTQEELDI